MRSFLRTCRNLLGHKVTSANVKQVKGQVNEQEHFKFQAVPVCLCVCVCGGGEKWLDGKYYFIWKLKMKVASHPTNKRCDTSRDRHECVWSHSEHERCPVTNGEEVESEFK